MIRKQHKIVISTLDAFFVSIAACFPFELDLSPNWTLADESKTQTLFRNSIQNLLAKHGTEIILPLLSYVEKGGEKRAVASKLFREILALRELANHTDRSAWASATAPKMDFPNDYDFSEKVREIEKLIPLTKKGTPHATWIKAYNKSLDALLNNDFRAFASAGFVAKVIAEESTFAGKPIPPELANALQPAISQTRYKLLKELQNQTLACRTLLDLVEEEYTALSSNYASLSFSDTKRTLFKQSITSSLDDIYYRLDSTISHILFDEFQDTSRSEWVLLEPFVDEVLSKAAEDNSFFCVGDTKQAIYGWRGGVAEIFDSLELRWPQIHSESRDLTYRCSSTVVDMVNQVFSEISNCECLSDVEPAAKEWESRFPIHTTAAADQTGYFSFANVEDETGEEIEDEVIRTVKELLTTGSQPSIGILTRGNATAASIIESLREAGLGQFVAGDAGSKFSTYPAIRTILSVYELAEWPGSSTAAYFLSTTPLAHSYGLIHPVTSKSQAVASRKIRREIASLGVVELTYRLVSDLFPHVTVQEYQLLLRFCELTKQLDNPHGPRSYQLLEIANLLRASESAHASVRIMTIHQSKGLEFDAVILPELDFKMLRPEADSVVFSREDPFSSPNIVSRYPDELMRGLSPELKKMHGDTVKEQLKESLSVLYVALTRARHAIYCVSTEPTEKSMNKPTFGNIIREQLGIQVGENSAFGKTNWANIKKSTNKQEKSSTIEILPVDFTKAKQNNLRILGTCYTVLHR